MKILNRGLLPALIALCLSASMMPIQAIASPTNERDVAIESLRASITDFKADETFDNLNKATSVVLAANIKSVSIKKLTAQNGAFKVTWSKPSSSQLKNITGYQILWSTNKNMKNAGTKTVKKSSSQGKSRSAVIKGLIGKKKYYVKIRTYKKYGWGNDYSSWSKAKTVTTKKTSGKASKVSISSAVGFYNRTFEYSGERITPSLTLQLNGKTLRPGIDYSITYQDNRFPGTGKIIVTGLGQYTGSKTFTFSISSSDIVIGSYLGVAITTSGSSGIITIPSSNRSYSYYSFTAYSDGTCRLIMNSKATYGAWAPYSVDGNDRYYAIVLDDGNDYLALLAPNGDFTMMWTKNSNYVAFFES